MAFNYWQKFEPGVMYHVYNRTAITGLKLFKDESDYANFLKKYDEYFHPYFETYAYCLIPNHYHLFIKVRSREEIMMAIGREETRNAYRLQRGEIAIDEFIIDQFRRFLSSISIRYNNKYDRRGPVLMKRFKRVSVSENKASYLICYIHHNPIHHGLREDYTLWKHSSYRTYLSDRPSHLERSVFLGEFGGRESFKEVHAGFKALKQEAVNCE